LIQQWKREVLEKMGIEWVELSDREWLILLLGIDGKSPIVGEHVFHTIFFLYPLSPFDVKPLFVVPYSPDIAKLIAELRKQGVVERRLEVVKNELVDVYSLTTQGATQFAELLRKLRGRWVLLDGLVAKPAERLIEELEALKRTYNGKSPKSILRLLLNKVRSEDTVVTARIGKDAVEYLKTLIRYGVPIL